MNTEIVTNNQKKINNLMKKYEEVTNQLFECPIDDILIITTKRQGILDEIADLDHKIRLECSDTPIALSAYLNKCSRSELTSELQEIFDLRQQFNAMTFRVTTAEPDIKKRIIDIRDDLVNKIKENNSSQDAVAAKYAQTGTSSGENLFFPKNKKSI